jgi:hypothetical protein
MKWFLFALSLYALLVAYNVLFWMPGNYDWFNFLAAALALAVAAVLAWFSGRRFAGKQASWRAMIQTPPAVIWIFVVALICCAGTLKLLVYRPLPSK